MQLYGSLVLRLFDTLTVSDCGYVDRIALRKPIPHCHRSGIVFSSMSPSTNPVFVKV